MCNIREQEAFIICAVYKTQSYWINRNSMGGTSIVNGEEINVHKYFLRITEEKRR